MFSKKNSGPVPIRRGLFGAVQKSINNYGIIRWVFSLPMIFVYSISFALLIPEYETPFQVSYQVLNKKMNLEKSGITTPAALSTDFFYYSGIWLDMAGENPLAHNLMTSSLEYLFKSMSFLKNIHDKDEAMIKKMVMENISRRDREKINKLNEQDIYGSIINKGEYFTRLFEQLFARHGLKKLGTKYTDADVEVFFNLLCRSPEERQFRRLLGALVLNVPYYLVIKNSINEYYQNSGILIPVDLFCFTLFMMFLDEVKNIETRPSMEECRDWVFSVIVPDEETRNELKAKTFSVQQIIREEMIMPNPGYVSKGYHWKKHKAVDIASGRGTMIRSPISGTVKYYEKSPKKFRTGNFIIIKDERSQYNIFICHMDEKDYIEEHSTEGELAEPIANLEPDWIHPLKKGQFFQVVGSSGKSTGAHSHIQIARRSKPYTTFDFLSVNKPYKKKFNSYLKKNRYWPVYSTNEELLLSIPGMVVTKYDSTRHFSDRDPVMIELYSQLQKQYTPVSATINSIDISLEEIPENILRAYFSRTIQEKVINNRYEAQIKYYAGQIFQLSHLLKQIVPLAPAPPSKAIPLTPWMAAGRRRYDKEGEDAAESTHDSMFYQAINKFFLYKILQLNYTPRAVRDHMLSDPVFTGNTNNDLPDDLPLYPAASAGERITVLKKYIYSTMHVAIDFSIVDDEGFCETIFEIIITACLNQGVPLDSNFGFFRYDMAELKNSYQSSKFIRFPDTREFRYNRKYDNAIMLFFLDILELAAEYKNFDLFRDLFSPQEEASSPVFLRIINNIHTGLGKIFFRILHGAYPAGSEIYPDQLSRAFQKLIEDIIKPVSYEYGVYADKMFYRAAERSIFYSLIYEVYLMERESYMKLFPAEELSGVIDAIGLFDSMFRVFCENTLRKQLIDGEHSRITRDLEAAEKELGIYKQSKRQLQDDFRKEAVSLKELDDYISRHSELFSKYFKEEEQINVKITDMEQTLDRYRNECSLLKNEKSQILKEYENTLENMSRKIDELRSKSMHDQDRFRIEMRNISYHKEKADRMIVDLNDEIGRLKKDLTERDIEFNNTLEKKLKELDEAGILLKKYKKAVIIRDRKISEQDMMIRKMENESVSIRKTYDELMNNISAAIGQNAKDVTPDELAGRLIKTLKQYSQYRDQSSAIRILQDRQRNDKRSLMLNASLISDLKDQAEKLQKQLDYLQNTTPSIREKELEAENGRLSESVEELKEEVRSLRNLIDKT